MHPTISQYIETLSQPLGLFRTLVPECERDVYDNPKFIAGGNAAVFKIRIGGKPYALKCHTKPHSSLKTIYDAIARFDSDLLYGSRYLPQEIYIGSEYGGTWNDATLTEWAEGHTLEFAMRKALRSGGNGRKIGKGGKIDNGDDTTRHNADMAALAKNFDLLAAELLAAPWAHGDLKPENIIVTPSGRMRLIDYDAMFVPQLQGSQASETGTPLYRHPRREALHFDRHIDDYPITLISATLHTLSLDAGLHSKFGNSDYFLFAPDDIPDGRSAGYRAALDMAARHGEESLHNLLRLLASPTPRIDGLLENFKIWICGRDTMNETNDISSSNSSTTSHLRGTPP